MKFSTKTVIAKELPVDKKRQLIVINKNLLSALCGLILFVIWAGKLAGFALSLAAIAGALLIVSKETIMSFHGYLIITFTKPFTIGDFIEIANIKGKVIDYNLVSVTLANTDVSNQLTGKTTIVPNSTFLSTPCVNASSTGQFSMDILKIALPLDADVIFATQCAEAAALEVTKSWVDSANEHLESLEEQAQLSLPSARPRVLWESEDTGKSHVLNIRFTCPKEKRVDCEQLIFIGFWKLYSNK